MSDLRSDMLSAAPAAGWYPDPANATASRWWDGAAWTEHVQPTAVAAVPASFAPVAEPTPIAPVTPILPAEPVVPFTPAVPQPMAQLAAAPSSFAAVATAPAIPQPTRSSNLDADGVPLNLFADSIFTPAALAPVAGPATQSDWHNQTGRGSAVRRQVSGSVSLSTAAQSSMGRNDPYDRSWITGVAIVLAILSVPGLALSVAWDFPPLTQSIFAGAPIAIALLALATAIRRGRGIVLPVVSVLLAGGVLLAGVLVDPAILRSAVDTVIGFLPF